MNKTKFCLLFISILGLNNLLMNKTDILKDNQFVDSLKISDILFENGNDAKLNTFSLRKNSNIVSYEVNDDITEIYETIEEIKADLANTKSDLQIAISNVYNKSEVDAKMAAFNSAISKAETLCKSYTDEKDAALKQELELAISSAKAEIVESFNYKIAETKATLESQIASKANASQVAAEIARLDSLIDAAETLSKTYTDEKDAQLKQELETAIISTKTELVESFNYEIALTKSTLESQIASKANGNEVAAEIARLDSLIHSAELLSKTYTDEKDAELKQELETAIISTKTELVESFNYEIALTKSTLESQIASKANGNEVAAEIARLDSLIHSAELLSKTYTDEKDAELKQELETAIISTKTELVESFNYKIAETKSTLESQISSKANASQVDAEIARLDSLIDAAETLSKTYTDEKDLELKEHLEAVISSTKGDLVDFINYEIAITKESLESKIETKANENEVAAEIARLDSLIHSAELLSKTYTDEKDAELKQELENAIITTKTELVDYINYKIAETKATLQSQLDSKADANYVAAEIARLESLIDAAELLSKTYTDEKDAELKQELENAIITIKTELVDYINYKIAETKATLQSQLDSKADANYVAAEIARLESLIDAAELLSKTYTDEKDAELRQELENAIITIKTELVDYINYKIAETKATLQSQLDSKADANYVASEIARLESLIDAAELLSKTYTDEKDAELKQELENGIITIKTELVDYINYKIAETKATLQSQLDSKANENEVAAEIARLESLIDVAETLSKSYTDEKDNALKAQLESTITSTKTELVDYINYKIAETKQTLENQLNSKANENEVAAEIARLESLIDVAETLSKSYTDEKDNALKAQLESTITSTKTELVDYINYKIAETKQTLENQLNSKANENEVAAEIARLESLIDVAETLSKSYTDEKDKALKAQLESSITSTKTELVDYINYKIAETKATLQSQLDSKANENEVAAEIARLESLINVAETLSKTYTDEKDLELKEELEESIVCAKAELSNAIELLDEKYENKINELNGDILNIQNKIQVLTIVASSCIGLIFVLLGIIIFKGKKRKV